MKKNDRRFLVSVRRCGFFLKSGFTLIELMIAVAVIGIIASIGIPKFSELIRKSSEGSTRGNLATIRSALSIYFSENEGKYPTDPGSLSAPTIAGPGKYMNNIPTVNIRPYGGNSSFNLSATTQTNTLGWGYNPVEGTTVGGSKSYGDIWVDSTCTDSKATVWNTY